MFENTRNHKIMIFVKRIFVPDMYLRLRSLLRFFVKRGPGLLCMLWIVYVCFKASALYLCRQFDTDAPGRNGPYLAADLGWVSIYAVLGRAARKIALHDWYAANCPYGKDTFKISKPR